VRVDPELKNKFASLARSEGKTTSSVVRELMAEYVRKRDPAAYIDDLWKRLGEAARENGYGPEDVDRIIREVREARGESG
ncbi:MAG: CopG family transcriptional regulator, partial [Planctomycetota bacterium]